MRYAIAVLVAIVVTLGLFLGMQRLIAPEDARLKERGPTRTLDFVRLRRSTPAELKKRALPQRAPPTPPPPPTAAKVSVSKVVIPVVAPVKVQGPTTALAFEVVGYGRGSRGLQRSDTPDIIPLVRLQPAFPRRAAREGVEGWVRLEFTVSRSGAVLNPRVIAASPEGYFEKAALKAIAGWKYRPRVVDGKAVITPGVRVVLNFELEKR